MYLMALISTVVLYVAEDTISMCRVLINFFHLLFETLNIIKGKNWSLVMKQN